MGRTYVEGWSVINWNDDLYPEFHRTRAAAVMSFLCNVDPTVYRKYEGKRMFPPDELDQAASKAWQKWRRKGYRAVHTALEVVDHRVRSAE